MRHAVLGLAAMLASCRFQDLTPGNSRRDEANVQAVVAVFYQSLGARNVNILQRAALPAATALMAGGRNPPVLVPMRTMIDVPERRNQVGGVRVIRTEFHMDGDVGTDRVVVSVKSGDGRGEREYEASDLLTLARRSGEWRVAHALFGPWRLRSAP